ncbi:hypothetical protein FACS1894184_16250 [Clostridia bacterium]|nr:hypothetical protein FACS1894184_16250 [Clostridia bacterium]
MFSNKRILIVINNHGDELTSVGSIRKWVNDRCSVTIALTKKMDSDFAGFSALNSMVQDVATLVGATLIIESGLKGIVEKLNPQIIITTQLSPSFDPNGTIQEVLLADKPLTWDRKRGIIPSAYVDIKDTQDTKLDAYRKYGRKPNWHNWGEAVKIDCAEAFESIYRIG